MSSAGAGEFNPGLWRALSERENPEDPPKGLDLLWHRMNGVVKRYSLGTRAFMRRAGRILAMEGEFARMSDARLREEAETLRGLICRGREKPSDIDRACAVIREGSKRVYGFRHHQVQVAGALAIFQGCVAEMATGEGKTLTATIPAILAGWRGRGCHVVTVNDYLAARDCEEMGKLYSYFHLKSASIIQESKPHERRAAYLADITYLTNKEVAADYLRDRIALGANRTLSGFLLSDILGGGGPAKGVVQRGLAHAIVDEATGRLMPERSWRDGLHQAVEAKEEVELTAPKETLARISFQRFFRLYKVLSGMTGTGKEARGEFWQIYRLPVVPIPTNRPSRRVMSPARVFRSQEKKWLAVVEEIQRVHAGGRPILVGTRSIKSSEMLSRMLTAAGLEHQVLNAVYHRQEAQIVAGAGKEGRITVATNMAGRGTDIKLTAEAERLGGLHVVATERHMSYRVDRQLYGRSARQGDPGSSASFMSLDDELPLRFSPYLAKIMLGLPPLGPLVRRLNLWIFDRSARRAEAIAFRQRQGVMQSDTWLKEHMGFAGAEF